MKALLTQHVNRLISAGQKPVAEQMAAWPSLCGQLDRAQTKADLYRLEGRYTRLYDAGQITAKQLGLIDVRALEKWAQLTT